METSTATEFVTTTRGDRVAYDRRGAGPALVFIAGAGPFRAIDPWTTETAERMSEMGLTTVVYDRLGRGESPATGRLDLERELDAVRAVIEVAGGSAVLCGHSSGCSIALRAAVEGLPVRGLALWEAPLGKTGADAQSWSDEIERRLDTDDVEGAMAHYMKDMPPEWLAAAQASPKWKAVAASVVSNRADAQSLAWAATALESGRLADDIGVPVLAMYGVETFREMPLAAERLAEVIPGAVAQEAAGANHMWEPEPMAATLVDFVQRCSAEASSSGR